MKYLLIFIKLLMVFLLPINYWICCTIRASYINPSLHSWGTSFLVIGGIFSLYVLNLGSCLEFILLISMDEICLEILSLTPKFFLLLSYIRSRTGCVTIISNKYHKTSLVKPFQPSLIRKKFFEEILPVSLLILLISIFLMKSLISLKHSNICTNMQPYVLRLPCLFFISSLLI